MTLFYLVWPFTSFKKFILCLLAPPLILLLLSAGAGIQLPALLQNTEVTHPSNHYPELMHAGFMVEDVENCTPFHGWTFTRGDKWQLKICLLRTDSDGRKWWAVNLKNEAGENMTSIPKFKSQKINQLIQYVYNGGWTPPDGWGAFYLRVIAEFGL